MAHRVLSFTLLLALLAGLAGSVQAVPGPAGPVIALVYVEADLPEQTDRFQSTGLPLYDRLDGALLTGADAAAIGRLTSAGLSYRILDPDITALVSGQSIECIYRAILAPNRPAPNWSSYGRLLLELEDGALLRAFPEQAALLLPEGVDLLAVTFDPKPMPAAPVAAVSPRSIVPDPVVQRIMDQVDSDVLLWHERELAGEVPIWVDGEWYYIPTRHTYSGIPMRKTTTWCGQYLESLGLDVEYHNWHVDSDPNVIGELRGRTHPENIYIFSGHVDDVAGTPGADDNASAVSALMVAADILTQYQWDCTIRFAIWNGEEQQLLGSEVYARRSRERGENILGVVNLDMIAWNTPNSSPDIDIYATPNITASMEQAYLFAQVVNAYDLHLIPQVILNPNMARSDHYRFWQYNYPAITGFLDFGDWDPCYHLACDTPAHNDQAYFTDYTKAAIGTFAHIACLIPTRFGSLDGHVTDATSGDPVEDVTIRATVQGRRGFTGVTGADGYYTGTVAVDAYTVTASHPQYITAVISNVQVLTDTVTTQDFSLVRRGWLYGYVTDADNGFPLDATISVPGFGTVNTDPATGYYQIYLDSGSRTVTASAANYASQAASVSITLGQGTRRDFHLSANISFVPKPLHVYVPLGSTYNAPALIRNRSSSLYMYHLYESSSYYPRGIQAFWPGPDGLAYHGEELPINWLEISGSGTPIPGLTDDSFAGPFDIGFDFPFYLISQTQFYASSNGLLSFGAGTTSPNNQCPLPNSSAPDDVIALLWDDLDTNYSTGGLYYQTFPSCPIGAGSCLIVEYQNWKHYGSAGSAGTFEAILFENGSILMQFLDAGTETGANSTTAIEGHNAYYDHGLTYACRTPGSISNGLSICYAYPGSAGCMIQDVPWLGENPTSGTIHGNSTTYLTTYFSATTAAGVSQPGDYYATLLVGGSPGARVPVVMTVYAPGCDPVANADFSWTPLNPVVGEPITLTGSATGTLPISYAWDFGDGGIAAGPLVTHTYASVGAYTVTMVATNACSATAAAHTLVVIPTCDPVQNADFSWTPLSPVAGGLITLTGSATGTLPIDYTWNFGDGGTAVGPLVTHTYASAGNYTITMVAANNCGAITITHTLVVTPACDPAQNAAFDWTPLNPAAGEPITLTGSATGTLPIAYSWNLGDGITATGSIVTHSYAAAGNYTVTLVAANACGVAAVTHTLVVIPACDPVSSVDFSWTPPTPRIGEAITLTGSATGTLPISYSWDLGDGATATGAVITHSYAAAGRYTVTLVAVNACGTASVAHVIEVVVGCLPPGGVGFSWAPLTPTVGVTVTMYASLITGTGPLNYAWDWGDGAIGSGNPADHVFAAPGSYIVLLTVSNGCGEATVSHTVVVSAACAPVDQPAFSWAPLTPTVGVTVTFSGSAQGSPPLTYSWAFGDGGMGSGASVTHTFAAAGTYVVTMTVVNGCGSAELVQQVVVQALPEEYDIYLPVVVKGGEP